MSEEIRKILENMKKKIFTKFQVLKSPYTGDTRDAV